MSPVFQVEYLRLIMKVGAESEKNVVNVGRSDYSNRDV